MKDQTKFVWQGRNDGDSPLHHRIFQRVEIVENYENISPNNFVLHGFAVDEGVRRNKGRVGAAKAPDIIRKNMSNFPVVSPDFQLLDFGNITCEDQNLEKSQEDLAEIVSKILQKNGKSIVLGGNLYRDWETDRKSTRLNSSHRSLSRMPTSA